VGVHRPEVHDEWRAARDTLRFHEAFLVQAALLRDRARAKSAASVPRTPAALRFAFDAGLPYELTPDQVLVGAEIDHDMAQAHPMNRLVQGEVGSGKTLVAVRAMLTAIEDGGQAALIAPTEVLATRRCSWAVFPRRKRSARTLPSPAGRPDS
jgi:ATP-dependent DNA helicase RecG